MTKEGGITNRIFMFDVLDATLKPYPIDLPYDRSHLTASLLDLSTMSHFSFQAELLAFP